MNQVYPMPNGSSVAGVEEEIAGAADTGASDEAFFKASDVLDQNFREFSRTVTDKLEDAEQRWDGIAKSVFKDTVGLDKMSPRAQASFTHRMIPKMLGYKVKLRAASDNYISSQAEGALIIYTNRANKVAGNLETPAVGGLPTSPSFSTKLKDLDEMVSDYKQRGIISPKDAAEWQKKINATAKTRLDQIVWDNPADISRIINDSAREPERDFYLSRLGKEGLQDAQNKAGHVLRERAAEEYKTEERAKKVVEENRKSLSDAISSGIVAELSQPSFNPQSLKDSIDRWAGMGVIHPAEQRALHAVIDTTAKHGQEGVDDPQTVIRMYRDLGNSEPSFNIGHYAQARLAGLLTDSTFKDLVKRLVKRREALDARRGSP